MRPGGVTGLLLESLPLTLTELGSVLRCAVIMRLPALVKVVEAAAVNTWGHTSCRGDNVISNGERLELAPPIRTLRENWEV